MSGSKLLNSDRIVPACETQRYNAVRKPVTIRARHHAKSTFTSATVPLNQILSPWNQKTYATVEATLEILVPTFLGWNEG